MNQHYDAVVVGGGPGVTYGDQKREAPVDACACSGASGRSDRCNRVADDRWSGP
jgi:hypothetical protein